MPRIQIGNRAKVAGAILLVRDNGEQNNGIKKISAEQIAEAMTSIDREEMHGFGRGARLISDEGERSENGGTNLLPENFWPDHRSRILSVLSGKPCFKVPFSRPMPQAAGSSIADLLGWLEDNIQAKPAGLI